MAGERLVILINLHGWTGGHAMNLLAFQPAPIQVSSTSAYGYVSIRQHIRIRQHTSAYVSIRQHMSAYVSIRQHTSAYVSIRQHTGDEPPRLSTRAHTG
jgi:predicted O-linked N-acetylglucosamine transferase (SPINDLY family)